MPATQSPKVSLQSVKAGQSLLMQVPLTSVDRQIIEHLQEDGRKALVTIARAIGITEKTARTHMKRLLDQDIIQIVALTSPAALGYTVASMAAITISSPQVGEQVSAALAQIDSIDYVVLTHGRYAIFAEIIARDMKELQRTIESNIGSLPDVTGVEIFPYFSIYYQQARVAGWVEVNLEKDTGVGDRELSEGDKAIVAELNLDGRQSYGNIAEILGISESQVRSRVQQMQAARQVNIMAIVNPLKLLNRSMAWVTIRALPGVILSNLANKFAAVPSVSYVAICAGRYDFFVEVICSSEKEMLGVIDSQIRSIKGVAASETHLYLNLHYKRLIPLRYRGGIG